MPEQTTDASWASSDYPEDVGNVCNGRSTRASHFTTLEISSHDAVDSAIWGVQHFFVIDVIDRSTSGIPQNQNFT